MPRGLAAKTIALIEVSRAILAEIAPATVRGVAYQLFVRKQIPSMETTVVKQVSALLTTARERNMIPWESIVDHTRPTERVPTWRDPAEYADTVMDAYKRDWWAEQPQRLLVMSEKNTVGGVLRPILQDYRVPFLVVHGWSSATAVHDLALESVADERPLTLLYVGDHDPSGRRMSDRDLPGRLVRYGGKAELLRLAITPAQMADLGLPTFAAHEKARDANYRWFLDTHGTMCCELDALNPNTLRDLVEGAITDRIDWERWHAAQADEAAECEAIRESITALQEATWL